MRGAGGGREVEHGNLWKYLKFARRAAICL